MSDQQQNQNNNSQNESDGSDDLSGLGGFFFFAFIVHPITAWILKPGRFERRKSIIYAIAFLAGLAAIKTGLEMQQRGPNYYVQLGVTRSSNPLEIKRAYKKLSLQLHPDKNPSPDATEQFDRVKQAYDVLMDMELREVYNKFGAIGIKQNKRFDETHFLLELAIFYVSYGMVAFMLTLGKRNAEARNWTFTGLLCMMVLEVAIMTSQTNPIPEWLFPTMTEYDAVWLMHNLYPPFMNGCRSLGMYLYVDFDGQTRQLLLALQEQNKDVLLVLREVQIGVQTIAQHGGSGGGAPLPSSGRLVTESDPATLMMSNKSNIIRATPTGKLKELQDKLQSSNTNVARAVSDLKGESSKGGSSNMGFYMMIMGYILISYLFSGN